MTLLFSEGLESGNIDAFSHVADTGGAATTISAEAAAAISGVYGLRAVHNFTTGDQNYEARAGKSFAPPTTGRLVVDVTIRLTVVNSVGYGVVGSKAVVMVRATDDQEQLFLTIKSGGLRLGYRQRSGAVVSLNSDIPVAVNTPVRFRLMVDRTGSRPYVECWRQNEGESTWTSVGAATDPTSGNLGVQKASGRVDFGVIHVANFERGNYTIDFDDISVRDSISTTEWLTSNSIATRINVVPSGAVDYRGLAEAVLRALVAPTGLVTLEALPDTRTALTSAVDALSDAVADVRAPFRFDAAGVSDVDRLAASAHVYQLTTASVGSAEYRASLAQAYALLVKIHAVQGEILPPVRIVVADAAYGSSTASDDDGSD